MKPSLYKLYRSMPIHDGFGLMNDYFCQLYKVYPKVSGLATWS